MNLPTDLGYFALVDPANRGVVTCWRRNHLGRLVPWPASTSYGPRLLRRDLPDYLSDHERRDRVLSFVRDRIVPWLAAVERVVITDPYGCAARFADHTRRCCCCPRPLTDPHSKLSGACMACRRRLPADVLAGLVEAASRRHLAAVAG